MSLRPATRPRNWRPGWNGFGQRRTGSGTTVLEDVPIPAQDIEIFPNNKPPRTYVAAVFQLGHLATLAGIGRVSPGALFRDMVDRTRRRIPWPVLAVTLLLAAALLWYGLMAVLLAAKVPAHTVNSLSAYRTLYHDAAGLRASDFDTAVRVIGSTTMARIFSVDNTIPSSTAVAPPDRPVPAPRVTTGTRCLLAHRITVCTSSVRRGRTTALGLHLDGLVRRRGVVGVVVVRDDLGVAHDPVRVVVRGLGGALADEHRRLAARVEDLRCPAQLLLVRGAAGSRQACGAGADECGRCQVTRQWVMRQARISGELGQPPLLGGKAAWPTRASTSSTSTTLRTARPRG